MPNTRKLCWLFLLLIVIVSFAIKFAALNKNEAAPSADYGNYLTQVDILHGNDVGGFGLRYNPVYFVFLDFFLRFVDEFTALKFLAAFIFSFAAVPFFLFMSRLSNNHVFALVSSWLFIFFEGFSEMIAWGGNPNFLGISFLLLALFFLVGSFAEPSKKNLLLSGFFLSFVVGTHFLVAAFTLLLLFIFVVFNLILNKENRYKIIKILSLSGAIAVVLSLPYIPVYLTFFRDSSGQLIEYNFLQHLSELLSNFTWLWGGTVVLIVGIIVLGIFALIKYSKEKRTNGLILSSLFLTPFILALITEQPIRWLYFLPIPVFICFGLFLESLFARIRKKRRVPFLFTVCLILVIGFATIVSLIRLENALDYYQTIGNDELQALRWIKANTTANAIFATSGVNGTFSEDSMPGNTYSWWIEGFSERKSYHSGLTKLYTYEDERLTTERINRIFAGTYGFEFNNLRVSESFPFPISNPEISAFVNGQYRNIIFLSDGTEELVFSPIETDQIVWHESPFYAENKTVAFNSNETWANATYTYEWSHLKVVKNVVVSSQDSSVDIAFHILPKNSKLKQFRTSLWTSYFNLLEDYSINNSTILLRQRLPSNAVVETELSLLETNGEINGTDVFFKDPKYSMPAATYSLTPLQDELYARFRITIISDNSGESKQSLELYNSNDLITELRINYFFINKGRINEYYRFLNDNNHFAVAFENEKIAIFRVL